MWIRIAIACPLVLICALTSAQPPAGDPFGGGQPDAPRPGGAAVQQEDPPFIRQLRALAARGPLRRATAISSLAKVERWDEVDRLLAATDLQALDSETQAAMASRLGPDIFLRIRQQPELSDEALAVLEKLGTAARQQSESVERLQQAIDQLDASSIDARLAATRTLLGGGTPAITQLVLAAVSPEPAASRQQILQVLLQFGRDGPRALSQLQLYGTSDVRQRALLSLAAIDREEYLEALLTALHASDSSDAERETARRYLASMFDEVPSQQDAREQLLQHFFELRRIAERIDNDDQRAQVWIVGDAGKTITPQFTTAMLAAYRRVADAATRLRRVGGYSGDTRGEVLAADLAYRLLVDPDWGDPQQLEAIRQGYAEAANPERLLETLRLALRHENDAAAIGLIRLIRDFPPNDLARSIFLAGAGGQPSPLVEAVTDDLPRVRYEAALAAGALADGHSFAGRSYVMRTLAAMQSLHQRPTAILVETRPAVRLRYEQLLNELGFRVTLVGSVAKLQREIAAGGDLRLILSKTNLPDLSPLEMVDVVRRDPHGRSLPIVFYGESEPILFGKRWLAPTVQIPPPRSTAALSDVLEQIDRRRRIPALSTLDRQRYRRLATELLEASSKGD